MLLKVSHLFPRPLSVSFSLPHQLLLSFSQRVRTWLRSDDSGSAEAKEGLKAVIEDSAALARLEGLFGHESAALARRKAL